MAKLAAISAIATPIFVQFPQCVPIGGIGGGTGIGSDGILLVAAIAVSAVAARRANRLSGWRQGCDVEKPELSL